MRIVHHALFFCAAILIPCLLGAQIDYSTTFLITEDEGCTKLIRNFNPLRHKNKYRVGVFNSDGGDTVSFQYYNLTFSQYLTATAGQAFDPPIQFDMVPVTLTDLMEGAVSENIDFMFASSAVSSCMATEHEVQPLVTIINRRETRGHAFDLDLYGGVIFTLAGNDRVNTIEDIKDKVIGSGGVTMMGGGQTQFYEMYLHGLSFVSDPLQMVFTNDEIKTVDGVLDGTFEVGFVRTDQIERHKGPDGRLIDQDLFKVINTQAHVLDDGTLFPFLSSTSLHPEWPVCALNHVPRDVSKEVQEALLALRDHKTSIEVGRNLRCDTTPELAELALNAGSAGSYTGFRTARSYFQVRTKQEATGLLRKDAGGGLYCIRGETLYDDIDCPDGHFKLPEAEFERSCERVGLECPAGFECYCKPCVEALEYIFQYFGPSDSNMTGVGCDEMELCGITEQRKEIVMRIVDNVKRQGSNVEARIHLDSETIELPVMAVPNEDWTYEVRFTLNEVAVGILEIFFDGVEIPKSPVRVQVLERQCDIDFSGERREANVDGDCVCGEDTVAIGSTCVEAAVFAIAGTVGGLLILAMGGWIYISHRTRKNDAMWQVDIDELHFDDPVEIIGQGSFGVVILAEYRGTQVAIKRAIKSKDRRGSTKAHKKPGSVISGSVLESISVGRSVDMVQEMGEVDIESRAPSGSQIQSREVPSLEKVSSNKDEYNLDFLKKSYSKKNKWVRPFPGSKKNDYRSRFHDSILGQTASQSTTRNLFAKMFPWFDQRTRQREEFVKEMRILSRLRHPCITTVMGAVVSHCAEPMLVMEHMQNGSLHDLLRNNTMYLGGEIVMQVVRDIAQGIRYLHSSKPPILHGDLKGRNILIDSRFRAKLCDFGLSSKRDGSISGTPFWLAPEYLRGEVEYNTACDIYSCGIILYEIYSRTTPYAGEDYREVLRKVCNRRVNKRPAIPACTPPKMKDLMKKCWSHDATFRPQARELDMTMMGMNVQDMEPRSEAESKGEPSNLSLEELFPKHIANALRKGDKIEPENHELVTIVFSDIIKFTDISRELSPLKVSQMLDRLYLAFDKIAKRNYVFKVETIGDAYMGVTNLEGNQNENHVKHIAEFAIEMVNEASKILIDDDHPEKGYINIRVGFHSGAVVSNVIGSLNPRYGLFGDCVNTASRMESNSAANRILCSESSYKILKEQAPNIPAKKRGRINVKGKGPMDVFWVGDGLIDIPIGRNNHRPLERQVGFVNEELLAPPESAPSQKISPRHTKRRNEDEIASMFAQMRSNMKKQISAPSTMEKHWIEVE